MLGSLNIGDQRLHHPLDERSLSLNHHALALPEGEAWRSVEVQLRVETMEAVSFLPSGVNLSTKAITTTAGTQKMPKRMMNGTQTMAVGKKRMPMPQR